MRLAFGSEPFWVAESSLLRPWVEVEEASHQVAAEAVGDHCEVVVVAGVVVVEIHPVDRAAVACLLEEEEGIQEAYCACQASVAYRVAYSYAFRGEVVP
jgi:hypothetical protein